MKKKLQSQIGVTLIEIMTTVVIVGILAAMATPFFERGIEQVRFRSQAKNITSMLRTARSMAISEKIPYGVNFDFSRGLIVMFKDSINPGASQYDAGADPIVDVDSVEVNYAGSYTSFTSSSVVFQPNGTASETGDVEIRYSSQKSYKTGQINVLASTGRCKIMYINQDGTTSVDNPQG